MIKKFILFFTLLCVSQNFSQSFNKTRLDSIYNLFTYLRGLNTSDRLEKIVDENPALKKCGVTIVNDVKLNLEYFSPEQQNVLRKILNRPILPNSIVSSNGFFRIHYTTSGSDAIGYDINLLAQALDSAYNFEVNYLGFLPPPSDGADGDDAKYDIYVLNIGDYGYTQSENKNDASSWTSFVVIDNDYTSGFFTHGINAARVTVAHEFHHAIQMGNYAPLDINSPFRDSDRFFYELTSTAFEEFIFDDVNDYHAYLSSYFNHPDFPLPAQDGYNIAIWNLYLQKRFGFEIIKRQWELMPQNQALKAIALSINEMTSTFENELNKFGIWTYFTKTRAIEGRYFEEAANYPLIKPAAVSGYNPPSRVYDMKMNPTSNYFLQINLSEPDGVFNTIVTNADWQKAIDDYSQDLDFSITVFNDSISGEKIISKDYSLSFSRDNQTFWNSAGILNDIVVYGDSNYHVSNLEGETYSFPSPFKYSVSNKISFAFLSNELYGTEVDLNIYSAGLELAYVGKPAITKTYLKNSKKYCEVVWDVLDKKGKHFSSGVYIYVIKAGDEIFRGKLVIFND
jgi:hypothetical protein